MGNQHAADLAAELRVVLVVVGGLIEHLGQHADELFDQCPLLLVEASQRLLAFGVDAGQALEERVHQGIAESDATAMDQAKQERVALERRHVLQPVRIKDPGLGSEVSDLGWGQTTERPFDLAQGQQPDQSILQLLQVLERGALGRGLELTQEGAVLDVVGDQQLVQPELLLAREVAEDLVEQEPVDLRTDMADQAIQRVEGGQLVA
jgi:hypothetical protein